MLISKSFIEKYFYKQKNNIYLYTNLISRKICPNVDKPNIWLQSIRLLHDLNFNLKYSKFMATPKNLLLSVVSLLQVTH